MDRHIDNRYAVPFLVFFVLALGVYFLASPTLLRPFPDYFTIDHQDKALVRTGDAWVGVDEELHKDMQTLGIERYQGELIALDQQLWLLNQGGQNVSHWRRLARFLRLTDSEGTAASLLRCEAGLQRCRTWGDPELQFDDHFMAASLPGGYFALADTSRHQVLLVNAAGRIVDRDTNYLFPNDALWHEDTLYIVDTDNHRVRAYQPENGRLGTASTVFQLREHSEFDNRRFPIRLARTADHWWLVSTNMRMAKGEIVQLSTDWQPIQRVRHPDLDDVVALFPHRNRLLAAGFGADQVWQIEPNTLEVTTLQSDSLRQQIDTLEQHYSKKRRGVHIWVAILALISAGFLFIGLRQSRPIKELEREAQEVRSGPHDPALPVWIHPTDSAQRFVRNLHRYVLAMPFVLLMLIALASRPLWHISQSENQLPDGVLWMIVWLVLLFFVIAVTALVLWRQLKPWATTRLGRFEGQILIGEPCGRVTRIDPRDVVFSDSQIYAAGRAIPIKRPQIGWWYEQSAYKRHLEPLLKQRARRLDDLGMMAHLLRQREPVITIGVVSTLIIVGLALVVYWQGL